MSEGPLELDYQPSVPAIIGLTERERRFAEAYVEVALEHGDNSSALLLAYRRAFPLADNSDHSAAMLARHLVACPNVLELVARLREDLARRRAQPASRVVRELERIAYASILDYCSIDASDPNAEPRIDLRRLTPSTAAAILEMSVDEQVNPETGITRRRIRLKMADKLSALDKLGRMHGLLQDKQFRAPTIDELDRMIEQMSQELRQRGQLIDVEGATDVEPDAMVSV